MSLHATHIDFISMHPLMLLSHHYHECFYNISIYCFFDKSFPCHFSCIKKKGAEKPDRRRAMFNEEKADIFRHKKKSFLVSFKSEKLEKQLSSVIEKVSRAFVSRGRNIHREQFVYTTSASLSSLQKISYHSKRKEFFYSVKQRCFRLIQTGFIVPCTSNGVSLFFHR